MCCHLPGNCDACKCLEFIASSGMHLYIVARSVSVGHHFIVALSLEVAPLIARDANLYRLNAVMRCAGHKWQTCHNKAQGCVALLE